MATIDFGRGMPAEHQPDDRCLEGDAPAGHFAVVPHAGGKARAMLTCGRDDIAFKREAAWDAA